MTSEPDRASRATTRKDVMTDPQLPAADRLLARRAEQASAELRAQDAGWERGWTRRSFLAGAGMAGVAALGSQLVSTRAAYAAPGLSNGNTLITIFMRGAADGLRILVPASAALGVDYLHSVRDRLVPAADQLSPLAGGSGWALNAALSPLLPFWASGELAFVPAVSVPGISRSHFQAQQFLERGSDTATTGWLDRALQQLGPGTTFRAVSDGSALPSSLAGDQTKLVMSSLKQFSFPGWDGVAPQSEAAIRTLYRGLSGPLGEDVPTTLAALATAGAARRPRRTAPATRAGTSPRRWPTWRRCCAPRSACRWPPSTSAAGTPTPTRPTSSIAT